MTGAPRREFVTDGRLGGYVKADTNWPNGDPLTYCPMVWDRLIEAFTPRTALDVGCGEGHAVAYLRGRGVDALGVDGCARAFEAAAAGREYLILHDFERGPLPEAEARRIGRVDLVWCCEFVEHVEEASSENFLLAFDASRIVCMTHAFPGQGGHHHVNCQPREYWIKRMADRGFSVDSEETLRSRTLDRPDGHWARSGLIFIRNPE